MAVRSFSDGLRHALPFGELWQRLHLRRRHGVVSGSQDHIT